MIAHHFLKVIYLGSSGFSSISTETGDLGQPLRGGENGLHNKDLFVLFCTPCVGVGFNFTVSAAVKFRVEFQK